MYSVELDAVLFDSSLLLCFTSVLLLLQVFHPAYFPVSSISGFFAMVSHNSHKRNRVALLHAKGLSAYMIHRELKQEQCVVPIRTIQRWCSSGQGSGRVSFRSKIQAYRQSEARTQWRGTSVSARQTAASRALPRVPRNALQKAGSGTAR